MRDGKRIRIYRRYDDAKEWVANCLVSLNEHPKIYDCVPDLPEDVKKIIEENLLCVKGQIWLTGGLARICPKRGRKMPSVGMTQNFIRVCRVRPPSSVLSPYLFCFSPPAPACGRQGRGLR
jgi:hypothetical protein